MGSATLVWGARLKPVSLPAVKVGIARETADGERREALVPEVLGRLQAAGFEVLVEEAAGRGAHILDGAYANAGATVVPTARLYDESDVIVRVQKPSAGELDHLRKGQTRRSMTKDSVEWLSVFEP